MVENTSYNTLTWQKEQSANGCYLIPEEAGGLKTLEWLKKTCGTTWLQQAEVFVCTVRHIVNTERPHVWTPRWAQLLTQKHRKSQLQCAQYHINKSQTSGDSLLWSYESKARVSRGHKLKRTVDMAMAQWCFGSDRLPLALETCNMWRARWRKLKLGYHWNFHEDNDPKHTSKSTQMWSQMSWEILECLSVTWLEPHRKLNKAIEVPKPKNIRN